MAPKQSSSSRDLRHRVLTCVTKLSDKDTHRQAVAELESIIPTLAADTFSLFINSLSSTASADRAAVRCAVLRLLASLSAAHGRRLSSHIPKLIAVVVRRLRDSDTAVRSSAATTTAAFAANITNSPFSSIFRPLADSLATEQDNSAQSAAAQCLSSAIDASPAPEVYHIVKLLPKWMKLLKCDSFKAKSALLGLIRSSIRVCEIGNCNLLRDLVICSAEFLKSEDWAARKAAAEALKEIAVVERDSSSELKASCLKTFESRKFDKVKAVREAMTQMVEAWREIPDVLDDGSTPPHSQASSRGDGHGPSKNSNAVDISTPQTRRKHISNRRSSPSDSFLKTTAGNRGADFKDKRSSPLIFRKLESKKLSGRNVESINAHASSVTPLDVNNPVRDDEVSLQRADVRSSKTETKSNIFSKHQVLSNASVGICRHHKECEDLSSIRKQLIQIETQQSNMMDLLQKFIGSSQGGMRTLETRVHGLEMALDDISYDLAVSTARMSTNEADRTSCWSIPGSTFLRPKFWRRQEGRSGNPTSISAMRNISYKSPSSGGVIVNPLAEIHRNQREISEASSSKVLRNAHQ